MFKSCQKKGQAALISGLVFGIASLIVGVIIAFIVVSTLSGANLLNQNRETVTVLNEAGHINQTSYTLAGVSADRAILSTFSITQAINKTDGTVLLAGNYTLTNGVVTNATETIYNDAAFNYTYNLYTKEEVSADTMSSGLTEGVDNVSSKIPTVLLIAAIVLILGILVLLVGAWQRMRIGGGGI